MKQLLIVLSASMKPYCGLQRAYLVDQSINQPINQSINQSIIIKVGIYSSIEIILIQANYLQNDIYKVAKNNNF